MRLEHNSSVEVRGGGVYQLLAMGSDVSCCVMPGCMMGDTSRAEPSMNSRSSLANDVS